MKKIFQLSLAILLTTSFSMSLHAQVRGYVKLGDIKGEATDSKHKDWIIIESMSAPVVRKDAQRTRGNTTLGDVVIVRELDKSSTKLQEACANGTFFDEVEIHFQNRRTESKLSVLLLGVTMKASKINTNSAAPVPTEEVTLGYTEVEWTYYQAGRKRVGKGTQDLKRILPRFN